MMAVSNAFGSNVFDILFGLPVPWLIATMMRGIQNDGDFVKATLMPDGGGNSKDGLRRIPYVEIFSCNLIFMILLLFLMVGMGTVGFLDDYRDASVGRRLIETRVII